MGSDARDTLDMHSDTESLTGIHEARLLSPTVLGMLVVGQVCQIGLQIAMHLRGRHRE